MKSFMKSLPSHRKKEKERKSRHNRRRSNHDAVDKFDNGRSSHTTIPTADRRGERRLRRGGGVMDDADGHGSSLLQSQSQGSGSIVEATQVQYPPPPAAAQLAMNMGLPRVSLGNNNDNNNSHSNTKQQKGEAVRNKQQLDANDEDDNVAVEQNSEETILSTSTGSVVEATQIQYPLPMPRIMGPPPTRNAIAVKEENNVHPNEEENDHGGEEKQQQQQQKNVQQKSSLKDDVLTSPVQSSLDITHSKYDKAYDEETVYDNPYDEETVAPDEDDGGGMKIMMRGFTNESIPVCGECKKDHDEDQTICNDYSSTMTKLKNNESSASNRGGDLLGEQHRHQPLNENDNEKVIAEKQPRDETSKSDSGHHSSSSNRNLSLGVNNASLEDERMTESHSDTMMKQPPAYYDQNGNKDAKENETSIRKPRDCTSGADITMQKRDHNIESVVTEQVSNNLHEKGKSTSADNTRVNSVEPSGGKIHTGKGKRGSNRVSLETKPMANITGGSNCFTNGRDPVMNNNTLAMAGGTAKEDNAHIELPTNNSSGIVATAGDKVGVVATGGETLQENNVANVDTDFILTSSDVGYCIKAMEVAIKIMDANSNEDPFDGIDIEQWHSIFQDFGSYMTALGNPNSTEAKELHQINSHDKVFAIFDRGMDVNHCNAVFIYNMIRTISGGIDDQSQIRGQVECKKLDHLAACLDMIFGVNEDDPDSPTTVFTVSTSKAAKDNSTVLLKFTMSLEQPSQSGATTMSTAIIPQPPSTSLPPHLYAMSQIFARYTHENMRTLQSQLDSTHKTLVATREGAMDLQRQALKLQDDLQDAHSETDEAKSKQERAEAELGRQKYVFDRKEESFERVKEHYKAEVDRKESEFANMKERYERELKEAKAELAKLKQLRHTGQSITEQGRTDRSSKQRSYDKRSSDQRKRKESSGIREGHQSKHHRTSEHHHSRRRQSTPHPNPNHHAHEAAEASDDQISPSIPRKIEYFATDPYDCDLGSLDESRKKSRRSSMSGGSSRRSRSAPNDLQPPRRPRSLSEPRRMDDSGRDERLSGDTKHQRNPLKSLPENNRGDHSTDAWCSNLFGEKKDSRSKRRDSSGRRNDRQPNTERADSREEYNSKQTTSSNSRKTIKNPYNKKAKPASKPDAPSYAFQEVVRGKDARAALPGHDCEECRKFLDALGNDTGFRDTIVQECSRHRSRFAPPSTPKDYWRLTFADERDS